MSNIAAALLCCCQGEEPGTCCTQFPLPLPPEMRITWTGNISAQLTYCPCGPVPNFECPCGGSLQISGGLLAYGPLVIVEGECSYDWVGSSTPGELSYYCPCACSWEDPPGSGQFYNYCADFPEGCGPFDSPASAYLYSFGANLGTGRWNVEIAFQSLMLGQWDEINGLYSNSVGFCMHSAVFGTRSFNPVVGYDTLGPLLFVGPEIVFCPDGTVDIRSAFGSYSSEGSFFASSANVIISAFNPGSVVIS